MWTAMYAHARSVESRMKHMCSKYVNPGILYVVCFCVHSFSNVTLWTQIIKLTICNTQPKLIQPQALHSSPGRKVATIADADAKPSSHTAIRIIHSCPSLVRTCTGSSDQLSSQYVLASFDSASSAHLYTTGQHIQRKQLCPTRMVLFRRRVCRGGG